METQDMTSAVRFTKVGCNKNKIKVPMPSAELLACSHGVESMSCALQEPKRDQTREPKNTSPIRRMGKMPYKTVSWTKVPPAEEEMHPNSRYAVPDARKHLFALRLNNNYGRLEQMKQI